jgi:hypothetical protein
LDAAPLVFDPVVQFNEGFFDLSVPIPANTMAGTHVLKATIELGTATETLSASVVVCSNCGPKLGFLSNVGVAESTMRITRGSQFTLIGDNFVSTEMLTILVDQGQLNSTILAANVQVDSNGHFEASLTVTAAESFGPHNITATGSGAYCQPPDRASIVLDVLQFPGPQNL